MHFMQDSIDFSSQARDTFQKKEHGIEKKNEEEEEKVRKKSSVQPKSTQINPYW